MRQGGLWACVAMRGDLSNGNRRRTDPATHEPTMWPRHICAGRCCTPNSLPSQAVSREKCYPNVGLPKSASVIPVARCVHRPCCDRV